MTTSTPSTWMPRAATSVATNTGSFPEAKRAKAFSLMFCLKSPCIACARIPSVRSFLLADHILLLYLKR